MPEHTDKQFEEELRELKESILAMGGIVEEMIARAMQSVVERNSRLSEEILKREQEVNRLEMEIDDRCIRLLALRQPAASDLRFIIVGLKISKDLERMGDLAVDVCQQAVKLNPEPQLKPYVDLPLLAEKSQQMVKNSLDSFVKRDAALAQKVCEADDEVDRLKDLIFEDVTRLMQQEASAALRGTRLIIISRHLERIADHATNIAEEVIYMAQGRDIRHGHGQLIS